MYNGTSLIRTLQNKDTSIIRTLYEVPKLYTTTCTSDMRTSLYSCLNGVHNREVTQCTCMCTSHQCLFSALQLDTFKDGQQQSSDKNEINKSVQFFIHVNNGLKHVLQCTYILHYTVHSVLQWNLYIIVTLGIYKSGCYTEVTYM